MLSSNRVESEQHKTRFKWGGGTLRREWCVTPCILDSHTTTLLIRLLCTVTIARVFQLGCPTMTLSSEILLSMGLPIRFYSLDDSVMFLVTYKSTT